MSLPTRIKILILLGIGLECYQTDETAIKESVCATRGLREIVPIFHYSHCLLVLCNAFSTQKRKKMNWFSLIISISATEQQKQHSSLLLSGGNWNPCKILPECLSIWPAHKDLDFYPNEHLSCWPGILAEADSIVKQYMALIWLEKQGLGAVDQFIQQRLWQIGQEIRNRRIRPIWSHQQRHFWKGWLKLSNRGSTIIFIHLVFQRSSSAIVGCSNASTESFKQK